MAVCYFGFAPKMSRILLSLGDWLIESVLQCSDIIIYSLFAIGTQLIGRNTLRNSIVLIGSVRDWLWTAAFNGHTAVVRALVSAGADVNWQRNDGFSPLSVASQKGHIDCVKLLIEHGAEVETRNNKGATPLYWACLLYTSPSPRD